MVVFAGQGDARRSLELLWRKEIAVGRPARPGPKQALSVDEIVGAAITVADTDGMAALSMRAVGERLGRTAMALYTYVPGKAELVDLMYDHVLTELPEDHDLSAGWRPAAGALARGLWDLHLRHPWLLQVSHSRPVLGPGEFRLQQLVLRVFFETGLSASVVRRVVGTLLTVVRGSAQIATESRQAARESGRSEEDWWFSRAAVLGELVPDLASRYPLVARLGAEPAASPQPGSYVEREARLSLEAGLALLLDGVEAAIAREA